MDREVTHYQRAKLMLGCAEVVVSIALWPALVWSGISAHLEKVATRAAGPHLLSFLFFACVMGCVQLAAIFPFAVTSEVLVERRYGLSRQSWRGWLWDQAKAMAVVAVIAIPALVVFFYLWNALPQWWWIPFATVVIGAGVALSVAGPRLVLPLFHRLEPVQDPELVRRLGSLLRPLGLEVEAVLRMELSSKSRKANAALVGAGPTRRIVLSDTLLDAFPPDEIECVVAHEIGHHYHKHMRKLVAAGAMQVSLGLAVSALLYPRLSAVCGVPHKTLAALPLMPFLFMLWSVVTSPILNALSRRFEWEADRFVLDGRGKAQAFSSALRRLGAMNMADPTPHPLVEFLFHSHPSLARRIEMAECYEGSTVN
ncbi:MAG: M48 family metallopeptidase [candidate division KSB1 bacterium]|nr:M48 family metallopeptidase [candidate division KSB1 bacterium]